ncbi:response regulator [Vibrio hannami]|uniref:response regulator n=1 Tax=Vibrio hannami TaxID=2717094 RepID=UPI00240FE3CA|nr:response regulator [Vibrio hannami]MDG3087967.1 response regulator [Vibrio hannami]
MNKYLILCVDDEREVLDSVVQDLSDFEDDFIIEGAESVAEAREVLDEYQEDDVKLALILCDHIMPQETGISFLIELNKQEDTKAARKLLLTGQADLEDTIQAVNNASLDYYIAKPWKGDELVAHVTEQLTSFVIQNEDDLMPWARILDTEKIFNAIADKRTQFGE